jgi:phage-related protein
MPTVGAGAYEIRIHILGEWRVIYVPKPAQAVDVLPCFHKKKPENGEGRYRTGCQALQNHWRMSHDIPY